MERQYLLEIQKFLMAYGNPRAAHTALNAKYGKINVDSGVLLVGTRTHIVYVYNLEKGHSPSNATEREANGLVLDRNFEIVSFGLSHVETLADHNENKVRWNYCWIEPNFKGTRFTVYRIDDSIFIQSGKVADLATSSGANLLLYKKITEVLRHYSPNPVDPFAMFRGSDIDDRYTWTFILVENSGTSIQKIISPPEVVLISSWNKNFNMEVRHKYVQEFAGRYGLITPTCYVVAAPQEVKNVIKWKLKQGEPGVIVVDNYGNRLYVPKLPRRTPASKALNSADNVTPEHLAKLVLSGESMKFEVENPVYAACLGIMRVALGNVIEEIDAFWIDLSKEASCKKHFAELVSKSMYSVPLFALWQGKADSERSIINHISVGMLLWEVMYSQKLSFNLELKRLKDYLKSEEKEMLHGVQNG